MTTRLLWADSRTVITADTTRVSAWHAHRRPDTARLDDPVDLARFARWNLPPGMSRRRFTDLLVLTRQAA